MRGLGSEPMVRPAATRASIGAMSPDADRTPVIVDGLRTPFGRYGGALKDVRPDDMAALVIRSLVERTGIEPAEIDDVILGAANQAGEDNRNVGRMAALLAGLPIEVPATVNRLCGSGLQAVVPQPMPSALATVPFVAGGVESMTRAPLVTAKPPPPSREGADDVRHDARMALHQPAPGRCVLPVLDGRDRRERRRALRRHARGAGRLALASQQRWKAAHDAGRFGDEIVPIDTPAGSVAVDEHPRPDATLESLAALKPAFKRDASGSVTAGNSSGINDGAAALLVMSAAGPLSAACARWRAWWPRPWPGWTSRPWASARSPPASSARARRPVGR